MSFAERNLTYQIHSSPVTLSNHWANLFEDRREAAAAITDDEVRAWLEGDNYTALRAVLAEAVDAGELPAGTDPDVLADALFGPIVLPRLFHRPPVDAADIPDLVDQVLPATSPAAPV